ncbi:fungal-specific transcription factor domain-containing protein [Dactylonectria macrodidyma]|uniref:Fungal-specific transcription factor domain-containing protein n=1 Tax=Dactylonectria macrodidyma TaxID=307937 RepID=A0A9P9FQC6_9HYPO|nr:fungal-specific transcription factor domain-containing protein [Dactylonectria macrodidyma]
MKMSPSPPSATDPEIPSPSASGPTLGARRARRYGFACASCKSRKVKCNGDQPVCRACQRSGEDCVWPSQDSADSRLRHANARIRRLEASLRGSSRYSRENEVADTQQSHPTPGRGPTYASSASGNSPAVSSTSPATDAAYPSSATEIWFQVGIGEDGAVVYNGPTSRFHAGSLEETNGANAAGATDPQTSSIMGAKRAVQVETLRSQYSLMDSVWLPLIEAKPVMNGTGIDTRVGMALLDIYWTWLHPLHNCVYRPCLMMDLALGGQYCSDFLLMCIFGLAARHLPEENLAFPQVGRGEDFVMRAKELLLGELGAGKPSIPTIQGLLILGGRQCAVGKSSEGWLYTGMAIRMMIDIGLHLDTPRLAELQRWTPAETETRKRVYNSAYIWDKTLSLALGRPPSLIRRPYPSTEILDKFDDTRSWRPIHAPEAGDAYAPTLSWNSTTFCAFCQLHELTTEMMLLFSSTPSTDDFAAQIGNLDTRFCAWYGELQESLRIDDAAAFERSPPPHIVSLNLLYHALHILLRRPYLSSRDATSRAQSTTVCITHSKKIHVIHGLYARTFPHRLMTYQISYCIFTAATVEAQMLKTATAQVERDAAAARLAYAVRVLQDEASHTPGSGRSLDTIRRLLSAGLEQQPANPDAASNRQDPGQNEGEVAEGLDSLVIQSLPHDGHTQPGVSLFTGEDFSSSMLSGSFASGDELSRAGLDTGAGFHPDAFPWGMADNFSRAPNMVSLSSQGWCPSAWSSM